MLFNFLDQIDNEMLSSLGGAHFLSKPLSHLICNHKPGIMTVCFFVAKSKGLRIRRRNSSYIMVVRNTFF